METNQNIHERALKCLGWRQDTSNPIWWHDPANVIHFSSPPIPLDDNLCRQLREMLTEREKVKYMALLSTMMPSAKTDALLCTIEMLCDSTPLQQAQVFVEIIEARKEGGK